MTFARLLMRWRRVTRKTQPEAAAWLTVPVATYRNWEQGRNTPNRFTHGVIRAALVVDGEEKKLKP